MSINVASLNVMSLRDQVKAAHLLCDLQEIHFVCDVDACMLSSDFVFSAYREQVARGVSLLGKCTLHARVDFVNVDTEGGGS